MNESDRPESFEDRLAVGFSRAVTRRSLLQRSMQMAAAGATAMTGSLLFARRAEAENCTFSVSTWGCYCASTPGCGSSKCCQSNSSGPIAYDKCCGGAIKRCDYWTTYPYCWCSKNCCLGGLYGHYSCCDCWKYGGSSCHSGNTKCICKASVHNERC